MVRLKLQVCLGSNRSNTLVSHLLQTLLIQGDTSGCSLSLVDIKTEVEFSIALYTKTQLFFMSTKPVELPDVSICTNITILPWSLKVMSDLVLAEYLTRRG